MKPSYYEDMQTGERYTYKEMLKVWREKYEGVNHETGLYQYHWHTRFRYVDGREERQSCGK